MPQSREVLVEAVLIGNSLNTFVTNRVNHLNLDYGGIKGDLHFGLTKKSGSRESMYPPGTEIFNQRQISVVSVEECKDIATRLGIEAVLPEWLGANLQLSGFPNLSQLSPGSRILLPSGAGLLCQGENFPCSQPGEIIQMENQHNPKVFFRFVREAYGSRGIVCIVERPGRITAGDTARLFINKAPTVEAPTVEES